MPRSCFSLVSCSSERYIIAIDSHFPLLWHCVIHLVIRFSRCQRITRSALMLLSQFAACLSPASASKGQRSFVLLLVCFIPFTMAVDSVFWCHTCTYGRRWIGVIVFAWPLCVAGLVHCCSHAPFGRGCAGAIIKPIGAYTLLRFSRVYRADYSRRRVPLPARKSGHLFVWRSAKDAQQGGR